MNDIPLFAGMLISLAAGLLSFLSPCVLPIIPGYISLLTGFSAADMKDDSKKRLVRFQAVKNSLFFILGFTVIFIILSYILKASANLIQNEIAGAIVYSILGLIIIFFGLHTAGWLRIQALYSSAGITIKEKKLGIIGSFIIGLTFAFAWTPCTGPILASILVLSAKGTWLKGFLMMIAYAAGLGIPFLLTAFFIDGFSSFAKKAKAAMNIIEIVSGLLLIVIGVIVILMGITPLFPNLRAISLNSVFNSIFPFMKNNVVIRWIISSLIILAGAFIIINQIVIKKKKLSVFNAIISILIIAIGIYLGIGLYDPLSTFIESISGLEFNLNSLMNNLSSHTN